MRPTRPGRWPQGRAEGGVNNTGGGIQFGYYILGQEDPKDNYVYGYLITPTASGNLGSIGAPIGDLSGSSASVTFYVYTNNDGAPGTLLDTLTATVGTFTPYVVSPITVFASTKHPFLSSEQSYWVIASSSAAEIGWDANNTVPSTNTYNADNGEPIYGPCCGLEGALTLTATAG